MFIDICKFWLRGMEKNHKFEVVIVSVLGESAMNTNKTEKRSSYWLSFGTVAMNQKCLEKNSE